MQISVYTSLEGPAQKTGGWGYGGVWLVGIRFLIKRFDVDVTRTSCRDFFCHMPTMTSIADLCCEGFRYENMYKYIFAAATLLFSYSVIADEVTQCFEKAWAHPDNGGLGLHRGGAVDLCRGATKAGEVLACFELAWAHPDNGGLGLHRGGAIELCATIPRKK